MNYRDYCSIRIGKKEGYLSQKQTGGIYKERTRSKIESIRCFNSDTACT